MVKNKEGGRYRTGWAQEGVGSGRGGHRRSGHRKEWAWEGVGTERGGHRKEWAQRGWHRKVWAQRGVGRPYLVASGILTHKGFIGCCKLGSVVIDVNNLDCNGYFGFLVLFVCGRGNTEIRQK